MPEPSPFIIPRQGTNLRPAATAVVYEGGVWLFNLGLVAFIASLLLAAGMFFYSRSLDKTRADWAGQVDAQLAELEHDSASELIDFSSSISSANDLLAGHVLASKIFTFLEAMTHQRVQFTSFSLSEDRREIQLSGIASSYRTVTEQVTLLEAQPEIERVGFNGLSLSERGTVRFGLTVVFKPTLTTFRAP